MSQIEGEGVFLHELAEIHAIRKKALDGNINRADLLSHTMEVCDIAEKVLKYSAKLIKISDINERKLMKANEQIRKQKKELEEALIKVKTLKGLIPICANCKKIRNDSGYWEMLEVYIQDHSGAEFSHGLCDDCAQKLYPDYFKKKDKQPEM